MKSTKKYKTSSGIQEQKSGKKITDIKPIASAIGKYARVIGPVEFAEVNLGDIVYIVGIIAPFKGYSVDIPSTRIPNSFNTVFIEASSLEILEGEPNAS